METAVRPVQNGRGGGMRASLDLRAEAGGAAGAGATIAGGRTCDRPRDITGARAWDGQKGRLAVMIDCAGPAADAPPPPTFPGMPDTPSPALSGVVHEH